jgi:ubiquitin-like modifier-activating enzyme ATG7
MIKNVNTIEEYAKVDKMGMLQQSGETVSLVAAKSVLTV